MKIVEHREGIRAAVLTKALECYPDQTARPVRAFPQLDKLSSGLGTTQLQLVFILFQCGSLGEMKSNLIYFTKCKYPS